MKTNRNSQRWALTLNATIIAATAAGCTATGVTGAPATVQVTQAPQQIATPTPAASAPAADAPTTVAATGKTEKTGTPLPVTFTDPTAVWFTATVTPAAPQLAGDQATLLQQPPVQGSWASVYVTRVTVTVTAVSKPNTEFAPGSLNQLGLIARAGTGIQTTTTALASPPGCTPIASPLRPAVGKGFRVCLTTYSTATPPPTGPPAAGLGLDVAFTQAGATTPVVIWATDSSIPSPTYQ